jgi:hypothetical protein
MHKFEFCPSKLSIVKPHAQVLCEANSCPNIKQVALERQVTGQKIVANQRDAFGRLSRCNTFFLLLGRGIFKLGKVAAIKERVSPDLLSLLSGTKFPG